MLKCRIIPILNFNGFALIKTKNFNNPRMVGNPVQSARVFNSRNVDELAFIDIYASRTNRKINLNLVKQVIDQCFMPVAIGGNIDSISDINDLLSIGADKVILKKSATENFDFINSSAKYFGSQCITISVDIERVENNYLLNGKGYNNKFHIDDYLKKIQDYGAGEIILSSVNNDGMMNGYDLDLYERFSNNIYVPLIANCGAGLPDHFSELALNSKINSFGASSIFYFTQFTPEDVKLNLKSHNFPVRLNEL